MLLDRKYNNHILFSSLIGILLLLSFIDAMPILRFVLVGQYTFVMLYLVFSTQNARKRYLIDIIFVLPPLLAIWLDSVYQNSYTFIFSNTMMIGFFLYLQYLSIRHMIDTHKIDANALFGAINIYLIAGLIWAYVYVLLNHFDSHAFHLPDYESLSNSIELFTYYSYTTIATLGYGDITPQSAQARMLSVLEAVFGQLYLAIVIAKLVSIYNTVENSNQNHNNNQSESL